MDSEHGRHMHNPIEIDDVESLDSDGDSKLIDNNNTQDSDGDSKLNDNNDIEDDDDFDDNNDVEVDDDSDDNNDLEVDDDSDEQQNYTILNEKDISRLQDEDITTISMLTLSKVSASILLQHYNWVVSKVHDAWFADEEKVRSEVGLLKRPVLEIPKTVKKLDCGICFESYRRRKLNAAACGHPYCGSCWASYISISIAEGPGCLMLRCPEPSCRAAVGQDMINMLASDEDKHKYSRYLLRSYIENNRKIKWCPSPGCYYAVDFDFGSKNNYDVSCHCKYEFCWNCTEEAHRPVDCNTVAKWILKNTDESENTNWILANSKPCPKCKRPIEKNQGCMHMSCVPPCNFHFCWLCLDDWKKHGYNMQACNRFQKSNQEGANDETDQRRKMAKESIQKYTHYYERWAANHSSREKAVADLKQMQSVHIKKLFDKQGQTMSELKFVTEAWIQIVECRRVLKWTYAYGFYIPEHEHKKKQLFEYLQGDAELGLERLHDCAENELQKYLNSDGPSEDFHEFRKKLGGLTKATRNYFENLVRSLENGLSDVKSEQGACSKSGSSKNLVGTKGMVGRGKGLSRSGDPPRRRFVEQVVEQIEEDLDWFCEHCTYVNYNNTTPDCQMCNLPRHLER